MKHLLLLLLLLSFNAFAEPALLFGEPPVQREDGAPFDIAAELEGFNVYCGTASGDYVNTYTFTGYQLPVTEWAVDLPNGVSYCVVTAVDNDGRESTYSQEVTIAMSGKYPPLAPNVTETIINIIITLPQTNSSTPSLTTY